MSTLSTLAENLVGSEIVRLGNAINERIRKGETIYNYTIGDFDPSFFPIPEALKQAIGAALQSGHTNYPAAEGLLELRDSVAAFVKERFGLDYAMDEIQIASGGRPLIYTIFKTIVDAGDKVIYAVPSWNNNHYTTLNAGEHCLVETLPENNFMPLPEDIRKNIKGATLICMCTPQNPTGTTIGKDALSEICDIILEENKSREATGDRKVYLMYDQIYSMLTFSDTVHHNPVSVRPDMKEYTVFVDGISKVFAATGLRVGWALGPAKVIGKMKAFLSHIGAWAPMPAQKGVASFLRQKDAIDGYLEQFKAGIEQRLNQIFEGIMALKEKGYPVDAIAPKAAMYFTLKMDLKGRSHKGVILKTQEDVTNYILSEAKLAMVPFICFGADAESPWYRLSVGTCRLEDIPVMMAGLEAALDKLEG